MRSWKWQLAAILALIPTVFGQLSPVMAADSAPAANTYPAITVTDELVTGNSVTASAADWSGTPAPTITGQWYSCTNQTLVEGDSLPVGCVAISGATASTLALTNQLKAKFLLFGSFATNSVSGATPVVRYSATTETAVSASPALKATVLGSNSTVKFTQSTTAAQNSKYTVDLTGWVTAQTTTYKWYRCDNAVKAGTSAPSGCDEIAGATSASYVVTSLDVDKYVTSLVTAKNGATEVATTRIASASSVMQVPVNVAPATLFSGVVAVGGTLTAMTGTWMASPSASFTYQWYSCTAQVPAAAVKNAKCTAIAGETASNYQVGSGLNNKYLVVQVKATNAANLGAPVSSFSAATSKVLTAPVNTVAPRLTSSQSATTGQPVVGATVTVAAGTWTGNPVPTKTYRWFLCDTAVSGSQATLTDGCAVIGGATGTSIVTTQDMQGKFLVIEETATNLAGTPTMVSASTLAVQTKPIFSADPTISGTADSAGSLSLTSGASSVGGNPTETYAWAKCATPQGAGSQFPVGCTILAGKTESTIELDTTLEGYYILGRVTLTNVAGQTVRTSATTAQVTGSLVNLQLPKPTSTKNYVQLGFAVEASSGTWTGFPVPTYEYLWYRCQQPVAAKSTNLSDNCVEIAGANTRSYTPVVADASKYLLVKVTAVQGSSRISVYSPTSYQVLETPSFTGTPSVGNQHVVGGPNLVAVTGSIRGTSEPTLEYAWYRCSAPVTADSNALAVGCLLIAGANDASYPLTANDVGKYVVAAITMTNEIGSAKRYTSSSQLVNIAPVNQSTAAPVSSSTPTKVGFSISVGAHVWTGNPAAQFTYQWFRCESQQRTRSIDVPAGCNAISGQTQDTITPTTAEAGKYLLVGIRGYNEHGAQTVYSPSTIDVAEPPRLIRGPILNSLRNKGNNLEVVVSDRAGWPTPTESYRWFRCTSFVDNISTAIPSGCTFITGATSSVYKLTLADVTKYIVAEMKLKNSVGETTRYTASSQEVLQVPEIATTVRITGNQWTGQTLTATGISVTAYPTAVTTLQWIRCAPGVTNPASCTLLATGVNTYQLRTADRGNQIYVKVSARNSAGTDELVSAGTTEINMPPKLIALSPVVQGVDDNDNEARAATTVSVFEGIWDASPAINPATDYKYQWYLCSLPHPVSSTLIPADCLAIKNAIAAEYLVKATDKEKFLGFSLTVSNGTDDVTMFSATTARVYVVPLYMSGAKPAFGANQAASDGSPRIGYEIEASVGTWQGSPTPNYTYQWFSCTKQMTVTSEALDDLCQDIVGGTGRTFAITSGQLGKFLGVRINGAYKSYSDEVYSVTTTKSVVAPPVNTVAPRITTRYTYVQSTLKTTEGTWVGTPAPAQTHTWWECDQPVLVATSVQPENCRELANSTGNWLVPASQNGKYLSSLTISTNTAGSAKLWSASTDQIVTGSVNLVPPTVAVVAPVVSFTGSQFASTLVDLRISPTNPGDWTGTPLPDPLTNEYSWYRCAAAVANPSDLLNSGCQLIEANASTATYRPVAADVGMFLLGAVKNDNGVGASIVYTASTEAILQPPNNTLVPNISGKAFVDQTVTGDKGTWDGLPTPTYVTQWMACDAAVLVATQSAPNNCVAIDRATNLTFSPTDDLLGKFLVFRVTATNKVGEQVVWSASTAAVVSGPVKKSDPTFTYPATTTTPVTRLNPIVGQALTTDGGIWRGVPTPLKSYEWLLCPTAQVASASAPAADKLCELVAGENAATITPTESMRGKFLMVHVHASNENGDAEYYSATTTAVWMAPVVDHVVEAFGTTFHRLTVKAKYDTWKAFPEVTKTYEWFVCVNQVASSSLTLPNGCSVITGATSSKYKIPDATVFPHTGEYLVVKIRASNTVNSSVHYSATSGQIVVGPVNERVPTISGTAHFTPGTVTNITGTAGTWSPADSNLSYQWYRCDTVLQADDELDPKCLLLQGANSLTYQLTDQDPGKSLVLGVTGEKNSLNSTVYSASTALVTEKARNVVAPSVTGVPKVNETSTGVDGDWRGFPAITKLKTWYYCTTRPLSSSSSIDGKNCKLLSGATTDTVINDLDLVGKYLVYAVTASNKVAGVTTKVTVYSAGTEAVADPPVMAQKPTIIKPTNVDAADAPKVGSIWTSRVTWVNKVAPTQTYQWYRCAEQVDSFASFITELPVGCEAISAATDSSYTIRIDDRNMYIMIGVTGTNAAGTTTQFSNSTLEPVAQAPVADPLPSISGNHIAGATLTIDPGVWSPQSTTVTYDWYSCLNPVPITTSEPPSADCQHLSPTGLTYLIGQFDNGKYITVQVSGANTTRSVVTSYLLAVTEPVTKAPTNITAPSASGDTYLVGMLLTASGDTWSAAPEPTKAYQWYSCTSKVASSSTTLDGSCAMISGATQSTYQMDRSLTGSYILVGVTATNAAGSATIFSASTGMPVVAGFEPVTSVSVAATDGVTQITSDGNIEFTQTTGTWSHGVDTAQPLTQHRWLACSVPIANPVSRWQDSCFPIFDYSNKSTKLLNTAETRPLTFDVYTEFAGYYISVVEYVLKPGSNPAYDVSTNRQALRIAKTTAKVTVAPALWDDSPYYVAPQVTAGSMVGEVSTLTQINDWQQDTDTLSEHGLLQVTWRGVEAGTFAYQWFTCVTKQSVLSKTGLPSGCENIAGATAENYTPTVNEVRKYLGVRITATNAAGSASVWTKTSEKVTQAPTIVAGSEPTLNDVQYSQELATVTTGTWQAEPAPTLTYKWMMCPTAVSSVVTTAATPAGCTVISGSGITPQTTQITVPSLLGKNQTKKLVVQVIATNYPYLAQPLQAKTGFASAASVQLSEKPYYNQTTTVAMTSSPTTTVFAANAGETITMTNDQSLWYATPVESTGLTFAYSWYTCVLTNLSLQRTESPLSDCTLIPNETGKSLVLTDGLAGQKVMGKVTAYSAQGNSYGYATTSTTAPVAQKPILSRAPSVAVSNGGQPMVGSKLAGDMGEWSSYPTPAIDTNNYWWFACDTEVTAGNTQKSGCVKLNPPTSSSSYTPSSTDAGKYIVFSPLARTTMNPVTANRYEYDREYSASIGPILMAPAITFSAPAFTGTPHVGQTLVTSMPTVRAYPSPTTTSFEWYSCATPSATDSQANVPSTCNKIGDTNQTSITVDDTMTGRFIEIYAISTNTVKSTRKNTIATQSVTRSPTNLTPPTLTGTALANGTNKITPTAGTWKATPNTNSYAYLWYLCTSLNSVATTTKPTSCTTAIGSSTSTPTQLLLTRDMSGKFLVLEETATQPSNNLDNNRSGKIYSVSTTEILSQPAFDVEPSIAGYRHVGEELNLNIGTVSGNPTPSTTVQWLSCTSQVTSKTSIAGNGCTSISSATNLQFTVTSAQADRYVTAQVVASNGSATTTFFVPSTNLKVTQSPTNAIAVGIRGDNQVGANKTISVVDGVWGGTPTPVKAYNWFYCDTEASQPSSTVGNDCVLATNSNGLAIATKSITLTSEYRGKYIVAVEVATNTSNKPDAGSAQSVSASIGPILMAPAFSAAPTVSGVLHVGQTITANLPSVTAYPLNDSTYEWWSCSSSIPASASSLPVGCATLTGFGDAPLVLTSDLAGKFIAVAVSSSNASGTVTKSSTALVDVTRSPVNIGEATISGDAKVGALIPLSVSTGTWTSSPVATASDFSYSWYQCTSQHGSIPLTLPVDCTVLPQQTAANLTPTNAMAGKYLLAKVSLSVRSNLAGAGSSSVFTASTDSVRNLPQFGSASPTITGIAHIGETLTATLATATGNDSPTSTYAWWQCTDTVAAGSTDITANCSEIANSSNDDLVIGANQVGKRIALLQTATNSVGSSSRASASTFVVSSTPSNTGSPAISGSDIFSATATTNVTTTAGTWTGSPAPVASNYTYLWYQCANPSDAGSAVPSGCTSTALTSATIPLNGNWVDKYLVVKVTATTATNKTGTESSSKFSSSFGPIRVAPTNTVSPSFSPTSIVVGRTITANVGTWTGTNPKTFSYKWFSCASTATVTSTGTCTAIAGFDNQALVVPATMSGKKLLLTVSATNSAGTSSKSVISSATVAAAALTPLALRAIL